MQDQSNLPAVIAAAARSQSLTLANVTLIMPTETFGAVLGEFDKVTIETVRIDTADEREVYEPNGKGKGFALGKSSLQKVASALSIQWDPRYTGIVESDKTRSRAKAVGMMRKPNGEVVTITEEKTIDLDVERDNEKAKAEKNSQGGRVVRWEGNRPIKEPWPSEAERIRWTELEIENAIKQKRRFKDELANTGAKDRVIRAFLALKSTYTADELSRPLAFPRVTTDTSKLLSDPRTRATAISMIGYASASLFGPGKEELLPEGASEEPMRNVGPNSEGDVDAFGDPIGRVPLAAQAAPPNPRVEEIIGALHEWAIVEGPQASRAQKILDRGETDLRILEPSLVIVQSVASGYLKETGLKKCLEVLDMLIPDPVILADMAKGAKSACDQRRDAGLAPKAATA